MKVKIKLSPKQVAFLGHLLDDSRHVEFLFDDGDRTKTNKEARKISKKIQSKLGNADAADYFDYWYEHFFDYIQPETAVAVFVPHEPTDLGAVRKINGITYVRAAGIDDSEPWYALELVEWFSWDAIHGKNS